MAEQVEVRLCTIDSGDQYREAEFGASSWDSVCTRVHPPIDLRSLTRLTALQCSRLVELATSLGDDEPMRRLAGIAAAGESGDGLLVWSP